MSVAELKERHVAATETVNCSQRMAGYARSQGKTLVRFGPKDLVSYRTLQGHTGKVGKLSTCDSFEAPQDKASLVENGATLEDMEGAAVAYVADILKVPAIFLKAVTNVVDGDKPSIVEYRQNLATVTAALGLAVTEVVDFINGKCLSELKSLICSSSSSQGKIKIKTEYWGSHSLGVMQNKINHGPIRPSELWRILERELVEDFGERVAALAPIQTLMLRTKQPKRH